jgi:spore coat protein H
MSIRMILVLSCTGLFLASCAEDSSSISTPSGGEGDSARKAQSAATKREAAAKVFAEDTIRDIHLVLAADSLEAIDADPVSEAWTGGTLILGGDTARDVGIRYKGSEGAWYKCVENGPSGGRKTCPLNMKVKIDRVHDTTFHGLKTFQLHAMNDHASRLVETVSYWFARRMGIPAPRTAYCRLYINGVFEGLYLNVEEMDARFVDTWQPGSDANIYKEVWPLQWDSSATSPSKFAEALQSNKKTGDVSRFQAFAGELAAAADLTAVRTAMEKWLDVDQILALAALRVALDDDDGVFHWYATDLSAGSHAAKPHNFFWMEDPALGKFRLLPWDLDKSFTSVLSPDSSNAIEILDAWGTTSHGCLNYGVEEYGSDWPQRSAACDKLVAGMASYRDLYRTKLQAALDGPFAEVDSLVDAWIARLGPVIDSLPSDNGQGITRGRWKNGCIVLRDEIDEARTAVEAEIQAMQ